MACVVDHGPAVHPFAAVDERGPAGRVRWQARTLGADRLVDEPVFASVVRCDGDVSGPSPVVAPAEDEACAANARASAEIVDKSPALAARAADSGHVAAVDAVTAAPRREEQTYGPVALVQVRALEARINEHFELVRFRLFSDQVNGGLI